MQGNTDSCPKCDEAYCKNYYWSATAIIFEMVIDVYAIIEEILMSNASLDTRTSGDSRFANVVRRIVALYTPGSDLESLSSHTVRHPILCYPTTVKVKS